MFPTYYKTWVVKRVKIFVSWITKKPLSFALLSILFVFCNELIHWPSLRFSHIYSNSGFVDLDSVLKSAGCYKEIGKDVYLDGEPCGGYWYGEFLLWSLKIMKISPDLKFSFAYFMLFLFFLAIGFLLKSLNGLDVNNMTKAMVMFALFGPPFIFLVERGNIDILIFLLVIISITRLQKKQFLIAMVPIIVASLVKFYTFFGLLLFPLIFTRRKPSTFIALVSALLTGVITYDSASRVSAIKPTFRTEDMNAKFGWRFLSNWIDMTKTYSLSVPAQILIDVGVLVLSIIIVSKYLIARESELKKIRISDGNLLMITINSTIFFGAMNNDYRLVLILINVVYLVRDFALKSQASRILTSLLVLGIFASWFSYPAGDLQLFGDFSIELLMVLLIALFCLEFGKRSIFRHKLETDS